jgi:putative Ig domain-containing protein
MLAAPGGSSSLVLSTAAVLALLGFVIAGVLLAGVLVVWAISPAKKWKADPAKSVIRSWIAVALVLGLLVFCGASFMISDAKLRSTLFGGLIASAGSAVAYYFSSRAADQARADILTTAGRLAGTGASDKPVTFTAAEPPDGTVGTPYSTYHFAANGLPPPIFWLADGNLPPGLQLDTSGLLHGTPTPPGAQHTFKVAAGNSAGMLTSPDLSVTIR